MSDHDGQSAFYIVYAYISDAYLLPSNMVTENCQTDIEKANRVFDHYVNHDYKRVIINRTIPGTPDKIIREHVKGGE